MPSARSRVRFKNPEGVLYHGGAVAYALLAYALGIAGLFHGSWLVNALATLLLAHGMTIAAYMIHECGHNIVFRDNADNARLGRFLTWICGAAYGTYEDIRYKHFRHHVDVDDVVWFDYDRFFREHPVVLRITRALEWCYVPAHDLIMHFIMVFTSFVIPERRDQRARNVAVILVRGGVFLAVLWLQPKAALLYAVAYMLMITILRFMDSLQHDYGYHLTLFSKEPSQHKGDLAFEQEHTFSNPHSFAHERLNWFTLNFGFHNAHHARPITPWWRLPALHRELFGDDPATVISLGPQLRVFHRHRVRRIVGGSADGDADASAWGRGFLMAAREGRVVGGNAAPFLTSF
jgi:fatty acid desaturase